jgi:hypothetical protein
VAEIEAALAEQISQQRTPTTGTGLPWSWWHQTKLLTGKSSISQIKASARAKVMERIVKLLTDESFWEGKVNN